MSGASNRGFSFPEQRSHESQQKSQQSGQAARGGAESGRGSSEHSSGMVGAVTDRAKEFVSGAASAAEGAWDTARHETEDFARKTMSVAEDAWGNASGFITRYPAASFFCAIGFGFLLGQSLGGMRTPHYTNPYQR